MKFNPFDLIVGAITHSNPLVGFALDIAQNALSRAAVPHAVQKDVLSKASDDAVGQIGRVSPDRPLTVATVKSSWLSGINWVAVPMAIAGILGVFGIVVPEDLVHNGEQVFSGAIALGSIYIWVKRTWFTRSILKSST